MVKTTCRYCEFCFSEDKDCYICADVNYGKDVSKTLDVVKDCYSEGLEAFIKKSDQKAVHVIGNTTLSQLKIDGRKRIYLVDLESKTLSVNTSKAKKLFADLVVLKISLEDTYDVKGVFSNELFKGGRFLEIK
ncbi:hypothetical protein LGL08_00050 [Clostridium estertheticum]|uniref:hypothetical protein n=1 Tax=Clostridium estertheticum TaxID=238834 RepID=UPI001CF51F42|nr:hypothetical protein [Clostridium estertheticum]MCB2305605.1 hypothetical protein [Clostridium estertheticum]MCB2344579.1 hypothetical protein [Clostridium estertheticum]MCB2347961.1 hypothetical protein [Clostridium estertheticum]WAG45605.1 hypothetical protein LL127_19130 [Clostridium estertheticum]